MTEPIVDGLRVIGLVMGFPLLLLGFMMSLAWLESWGLRESEPGSPAAPAVLDTVDAAVRELDQRGVSTAEMDQPSAIAEPTVS